MNDHSEVQKTRLHHKFIGLRLGGRLPVTLAYEMHHAAQWGGYRGKYDYGNTFSDFWNVFLFRSGGNSLNDQLNAQGNHIGFQELALTYKHNNWQVRAYWQSLFEDMSAAFIGFGMNAADGLWGLNFLTLLVNLGHSMIKMGWYSLDATHITLMWHIHRDGVIFQVLLEIHICKSIIVECVLIS